MLLALSAGQKTGLALVAAAFLVFALASAFWIPRLRPDFPGRNVRLFVLVSALFTAGMLSAVTVLGSEKTERAGETSTAAASASGTSSTAAPAAQGNAAAGKAVFVGPGACGACHTFGPAGTNGKIGPNLDRLAADAKKANQGSLQQYTLTSIKDPNAYTVPGFPKGVMAASCCKRLNDKQIADLVAFLTQKS